MKLHTLAPAITVGLASMIALSGCTAPEEPAPQEKAQKVQERPEAAPEAPTGSGVMPEWADGAVDVGASIGSTSTESWAVEAFQIDQTGTTAKDSMFIDPDSSENVLPAGSTVVYVNFVYTNISDEAIMVPLSFGTPDLRSEFWQYGMGQPGDSRLEEYEARGISDRLVKLDASGDVYWFAVEPGQSIARAVNIKHEPGSALARLTFTPALNAEGDLDHDRREAAELTVQIS